MNRIVISLFVSIMTMPAFATDLADMRQQLMASFTDSAQSHDPYGKFNRYSNAQVLGDDDNRLDFKSDSNHWGDAFSCGTKKCEITGSVRTPVSLPEFHNPDKSKSYSSYNECKKGEGDLKSSSYDRVEVGNCRVSFPAGLKAGAVQVNSNGIIVLEQGDYWFESFQLNNLAELVLDGPVTIFVKNSFHLNSQAKVNDDGQPQDLLFVVYGENDIAVDNEARLNGFLYSNGNLALNSSARISGRVNVRDLTLNNNAVIEGGRANGGGSDGSSVDHYELHWSNLANELTAKACADSNCSSLYDDRASFHVRNLSEGENFLNFNNFNGESTKSFPNKNKYICPVQLGYQSDGQGGNLSPEPADRTLICYEDGVRNPSCTFCGSSVELSAQQDIGYTDGEGDLAASITIKGTTSRFMVEYGNGELAYKEAGDTSNYSVLNDGEIYSLPVNTELYIRHNQARSLDLTLTAISADGQALSSDTVNLKFVPYQIEVRQGPLCPLGLNDFRYGVHSGCSVLAKAGESKSVPLTFLAYGVNGSNDQQGAEISGYNFDLPEAVTITELNTGSVNHSLTTFNENIDFTTVALVQVVVADHCAVYAGSCGSKLTKGSSAIVGRTVPASLRVKESVSGDVAQNMVYAAQPDPITFEKLPGFVVEGLDMDGNVLSSYSGEFAGGLKANSEFWLDSSLSDSPLKLGYSEAESGQHLIALDPGSLEFIKDTPFAETGLALPLRLTIGDHDQTAGVADEETTLADEDDRLRFGYLTLEDTELPTNIDGHIKGQLYYLDADSNFVPVTENHFSFASHIADDAAITVTAIKPDNATPPLLAVDNNGNSPDGVTVTGYEQAAGFDVELQVDTWLKPYKNGLVNPSARLDITEERRKHANDRTFNRREVSR